MCAAEDEFSVDTDKAAKSKLFISYLQPLIKEIKHIFHDVSVRKSWKLQELKDIAVQVANDEHLYQSQVPILAGTAGKRKSCYAEGKCYNCGEKSHIASNYPYKVDDELTKTVVSNKKRKEETAVAVGPKAKKGNNAAK